MLNFKLFEIQAVKFGRMSKKQKAKVASELKAKNNENNLEFIQTSSNQSQLINNMNTNALGSLSSSSTSSLSFQNSSSLSTSSSSPPDNSSHNVMSSSPLINSNTSNIIIQTQHSNINLLHQANLNQNNQSVIQNNIANLNNSNMIIANFNLSNNSCQHNSTLNALNDYSQSSLSSNSSSQMITLNNYHPQINQMTNNLQQSFTTQNRSISADNYQQHINPSYQNPQSLISENISNQFDQTNHFNNEISGKTLNSISSQDVNNLNYYKSDMNLIAKQIFDAHSRTFMCYIDYNQINQLKHNQQNTNHTEIQRIVSLVFFV